MCAILSNMEVIVPVSRFNKRKRDSWAGPNKKPRLYRQNAIVGKAAFARSYANKPSSFSLNQGNHGPELKDIDTDVIAGTFNTTGSVILLNGVAQGSEFNTRIGRKFLMKSLLLRFTIFQGSTAVLPSQARWMVVYDKQANAGTPAITDILDSASAVSFTNLTNRDRFIIIYDKIHTIGATTGTDNYMQYVKKYRKMNLEVTNGGVGATAASIQTGALWLVTCGDRPAGTTAARFEAALTRVRFTDD